MPAQTHVYLNGRNFDLSKVKNHIVLKRLLVEEMANPLKPANGYVYRTFAKKWGLPLGRVINWSRSEEVSELVRQRIRQLLPSGAVLSNIYKLVYQQAMHGSFKHQRLVLELAGEYIPGMRLEHSIESPEARFERLERARLRAVQSISLPAPSEEARPPEDV